MLTRNPGKLPHVKTETRAVHKENKQNSDAYNTKRYSNFKKDEGLSS